MFPVFVIDPHFAKPEFVGINRYRFMLESLRDLDDSRSIEEIKTVRVERKT